MITIRLREPIQSLVRQLEAGLLQACLQFLRVDLAVAVLVQRREDLVERALVVVDADVRADSFRCGGDGRLEAAYASAGGHSEGAEEHRFSAVLVVDAFAAASQSVAGWRWLLGASYIRLRLQ